MCLKLLWEPFFKNLDLYGKKEKDLLSIDGIRVAFLAPLVVDSCKKTKFELFVYSIFL